MAATHNKIYNYNTLINVIQMVFIVLLFLVSIVSFSQSVVMNADVNPGGVISELPLAPPKTKGNLYLEKEWLLGDFELINGAKLEKYPIKYDLWNNNLEIEIDGKSKICQLNRLKSYSWKKFGEVESYRFVNSTYLVNTAENNPNSLIEIVLEGEKMNLYKHYYLEVKEANYAVEFDMGNKDNQILKKVEYYVLKENTFYKLKSNLKKNEEFFGNKYEMITTYCKNARLKFKDEADIVEIIKHYDSLQE